MCSVFTIDVHFVSGTEKREQTKKEQNKRKIKKNIVQITQTENKA